MLFMINGTHIIIEDMYINPFNNYIILIGKNPDNNTPMQMSIPPTDGAYQFLLTIYAHKYLN